MRSSIVASLCCSVLFGLSLFIATPATAAGVAQMPFDWQTLWGTIDFEKTATEDPGIPSTRHPAKMAIRNAISTYGTTTSDLGLEKTYTLDINQDGIYVNGVSDIVLDGSAFFKKYSKAGADLCTAAEGCYLTIYIQGTPTNIITEAKQDEVEVEETVTKTKIVEDDSDGGLLGATATKEVTYTEVVKTKKLVPHVCPATAAANTTCDSACPATVSQCPGLYQYNLFTAYDNRVFSWSFLNVWDFDTWYRATAAKLDAAAKAALPAGSTVYQSNYIYTIKNTSPVLAVQLQSSRCYNEEMLFNNNTCIKYFQYDPVKKVFADLYTHPQYVGGDFGDMFTYTPYDRTKFGGYTRGELMGDGYGLKIPSGKSAYVQFTSFTWFKKDGTTIRTPAEGKIPAGFSIFELNNNSGVDLFVPTNSDYEFSSFLDNMPSRVTKKTNMVEPGKTKSESEKLVFKFTDWYGDQSCPPVYGSTNCAGIDDQMGTGIATTRVAERFCQSPTSAILPCDVCVSAKAAGYEQGCTKTVVCPGLACCIHGTPVAAGSYEVCASYIARHCVKGDQKVALPGGKSKPIEQIKAGDTILGFADPKGKLKPMKVKSIGVTEQETTVKLNDAVALTAGHKVIKASGEEALAMDIKIGDSLMKTDGKPMKVRSIQSQPEKATVYNVELENGSGFVVGGVRVTSMPKIVGEKE